MQRPDSKPGTSKPISDKAVAESQLTEELSDDASEWSHDMVSDPHNYLARIKRGKSKQNRKELIQDWPIARGPKKFPE